MGTAFARPHSSGGASSPTRRNIPQQRLGLRGKAPEGSLHSRAVLLQPDSGDRHYGAVDFSEITKLKNLKRVSRWRRKAPPRELVLLLLLTFREFHIKRRPQQQQTLRNRLEKWFVCEMREKWKLSLLSRSEIMIQKTMSDSFVEWHRYTVRPSTTVEGTADHGQSVEQHDGEFPK